MSQSLPLSRFHFCVHDDNTMEVVENLPISPPFLFW